MIRVGELYVRDKMTCRAEHSLVGWHTLVWFCTFGDLNCRTLSQCGENVKKREINITTDTPVLVFMNPVIIVYEEHRGLSEFS